MENRILYKILEQQPNDTREESRPSTKSSTGDKLACFCQTFPGTMPFPRWGGRLSLSGGRSGSPTLRPRRPGLLASRSLSSAGPHLPIRTEWHPSSLTPLLRVCARECVPVCPAGPPPDACFQGAGTTSHCSVRQPALSRGHGKTTDLIHK